MTKPLRARIRKLEHVRAARDGKRGRRVISAAVADAICSEVLCGSGSHFDPEFVRRTVACIIRGDAESPVQFHQDGAIAVVDATRTPYEIASAVASRMGAVIVLPARDRLPDEDG